MRTENKWRHFIMEASPQNWPPSTPTLGLAWQGKALQEGCNNDTSSKILTMAPSSTALWAEQQQRKKRRQRANLTPVPKRRQEA
jgi:hypothetical protein